MVDISEKIYYNKEDNGVVDALACSGAIPNLKEDRMKRSDLIRLVVIMLAMSMLIALFACDNNHAEPGTSGSKETEDSSNVESGDDVPDESDSGDDESESETNSSGDNNKCEHPYASTHEGHWKPACSVCGRYLPG